MTMVKEQETNGGFLPVWLASFIMVLIPGALYWLWGEGWVDRETVWNSIVTVVLAYFAGNIVAIACVVIAVVQLNREVLTDFQTATHVMGIFISMAILFVGYFEMGRFISEFVAG